MPTIFSGTQKLLQDFLKWLLILVPIVCAAFIAYHAVMRAAADGDDGVIAMRNKRMKNTLIAGIIAESASALVTFILSYYR